MTRASTGSVMTIPTADLPLAIIFSGLGCVGRFDRRGPDTRQPCRAAGQKSKNGEPKTANHIVAMLGSARAVMNTASLEAQFN